jgi:aspartyl-tRNA(Asn)/glutamyl-tRNA(Gln) amidotransferase subunit B
MEAGSMRADVNVSVRRPGTPLGTRCEIKNVNSMRFVMQSVDYEAQRQIDILEAGGAIRQETRLFDSRTGETRPMRSKEEAHDYRYFPDPDLLPLIFDQAWVDELASALPELPDEKRVRFIRAGLSPYNASVLVAEKEATDYFELMVAEGAEPKAAANWLSNEYFGRLNKMSLSISTGPIPAKSASAIVQMVSAGTISGKIAKDLTDIVWREGGDPRVLVETLGLKQVSDEGAIEAAVSAVISANPDKAEEVKAKPKAVAWFVGQVMKAMGGKANPQTVNAILRRHLGLPEEG